jgi:hypothetical protein
MEIPYQDKSNYLKGLLIVAKKDKQLADSERKIIRKIAERLGFAPDFYEETLKNLLFNEYILETPIKFAERKIAESFIEDGLRLAFSDEKGTDSEIDWLRATALANNLNDTWFSNRLLNYKNITDIVNTNSDFAIFSML